MSQPVTVRELRQNLSVYLRRVERGEVLTVTRRGEDVAVLAPHPQRRSVVDRLVVERGATPARGDLLDHAPLPPQPGERPLSEIVQEQREELVGRE